MTEPVEVSSKCWQDIEAYLEEIYDRHPFKRIRYKGEFLGYEGFISNFALTVEEDGDKVVISLVARTSEQVAFQAKFDKQTGMEEITYDRDKE